MKKKKLSSESKIISYLGFESSLIVAPFTDRNSTGNCGCFKSVVSMNQSVLPDNNNKKKTGDYGYNSILASNENLHFGAHA